jgi:RND family efflux transporter MFP subunit
MAARLSKTLGLILGTAAIVFILMWLMGAFADRQPPGEPRQVLPQLAEGTATVVVSKREVAVRETAIGTIHPVQRVKVGSRLLARITSLKVKKAGQHVVAGQELALLDDAALKAQHREAQAAYDSAEATRAQAEVELGRTRKLYEGKVESKQQLDQAATRLKTAESAVASAEQAVQHAVAVLDYATVRAPITGVVIDKQVEEGDLVSPGQVLVTIYDPTRMQLVARVRESLALALETGASVDVTIDALGLDCSGTIDQIVPEAEASARAFEVKVSGPCPPGVYSGMFARLHVPIGTRQVLRVAPASIRRVGQLELVYVVIEGDRVLRRLVQTGARSEEGVEVLAGLQEGERILADATDYAR